jgi:RimJ/RimL family protein N-acetyltransferase
MLISVDMEEKELILRSGTRLTLREARRSDAAALLEYLEAVSAETDYLTFGPGEFNLSVEEEETYLEKCQKANNSLYLLAEVEGRLVGALSFEGGSRVRTRHTGEFGISVRKEYWGQGVASALLDVLTEWAVERKIIRKLNLRVRTDNRRAIRLYERKGYVTEGTIRKELCVNGECYDLLWMGMLVG